MLRRHALAERAGVIILSALVAHTGWHWMLERGDILLKTDWPRLDASALATLARVFPDRDVVGIDCTDLVWGLGAFHCVTQQWPA